MEKQEKEMPSLFAQLVMMFSTSAMHHLGKLVDPESGKAEVNLEGARMSIDLLNMLQEKTRGNLTSDEDKMLKEVLTALRLNYVETVNQNPAPAPSKEQKPQEKASEPPPVKEQKEPRYHKSY